MAVLIHYSSNAGNYDKVPLTKLYTEKGPAITSEIKGHSYKYKYKSTIWSKTQVSLHLQ